MADYNLTAPVPGESPFVDVATPWVAGNAHITIGVNYQEIDAHWRLVRGAWRLECDGNAANRRQDVIGYHVFGPGSDDTERMWGYKSNADITANQKGHVFFVPDNAYSNMYNFAYDANLAQSVRLAELMGLMIRDDYIDFYIEAGLAGDLHRVVLTFQYLNDQLGIRIQA